MTSYIKFQKDGPVITDNTMTKTERACDTCIHFKKSSGVTLNQGECHRFPPTVIAIQSSGAVIGQTSVQFMSAFPTVDTKCSGCAEYKSVETTTSSHRQLPNPPPKPPPK